VNQPVAISSEVNEYTSLKNREVGFLYVSVMLYKKVIIKQISHKGIFFSEDRIKMETLCDANLYVYSGSVIVS
jgi:hypothetical protein